MADKRSSAAAAATFLFVILFLVLSNWLSGRRPTPAELRTATSLTVTSGLDDGRGSLREAILMADRASERTRILFQVDRITLTRALPPLVNPRGTILDARSARTVIDARELQSGAALEIASPDSEVRGLRIVDAVDSALLLRSESVLIVDCSIESSGVGIVVAGTTSASIRSTSFVGNRIGIRLTGPEARLKAEGNQFSASVEASIWAVLASEQSAAGASTELVENQFERDRISIVAGNLPTIIENNVFEQPLEAAIHAIGSGVVVRGNRISGGQLHGVVLSGAVGPQIEDNEINGNRGVGVLLSSSAAVTLSRNELYRNGYGFALVFGDPARPSSVVDNLVVDSDGDGVLLVGANPVIRANQIRDSGGAAVRVLDFIALDGSTISANPFIDGNSFSGNLAGPLQRGVYREVPPRDGSLEAER